MTMPSLQRLRVHAIAHSLFPPTTLKAAVHRLAFVQADPIRSPARAQDLILRHRVKAYRAGDLERRYASLHLEGDVLYAYGFLPRTIWRLLHPRETTGLSDLEKNVLDTVCRCGEMHPRALAAYFERERVINAWGGYSQATKRALEALHALGLLRVAGREHGIRVYEAASPSTDLMPASERVRKLVMVIAHILAPVPDRSLQEALAPLRRSCPGLGNTRTVVGELLRTGELQQQTIDGLTYVWPPDTIVHEEVPRRVRFLAPFDPLVWDRRRFEHLWRWPYRCEAYTPPAKRLRGYYAMPLLWGDSIIGCANARVTGGHLNVEFGCVDKRPQDDNFRAELEAEIGRLATFLNVQQVSGVAAQLVDNESLCRTS